MLAWLPDMIKGDSACLLDRAPQHGAVTPDIPRLTRGACLLYTTFRSDSKQPPGRASP